MSKYNVLCISAVLSPHFTGDRLGCFLAVLSSAAVNTAVTYLFLSFGWVPDSGVGGLCSFLSFWVICTLIGFHDDCTHCPANSGQRFPFARTVFSIHYLFSLWTAILNIMKLCIIAFFVWCHPICLPLMPQLLVLESCFQKKSLKKILIQL